MRNISSFYGNWCIVGRGWAGNKKDIGDPEAEIPWYVLDMSHGHNPGNTYYIDIEQGVAADMVIDYSQKIANDKIPDDKFLVTILEFLPTSCFEEGTWTLRNALRTTKLNGWIEVLTGGNTLNLVFQKMKEIGLNPVIDSFNQTRYTPGWYVKRIQPEFDIEDTGMFAEDIEIDRVYAHLE
jgi:hypothetical protein